MKGLPVLILASFPSCSEPVLLSLGELPSHAAAITLLGWWDKYVQPLPTWQGGQSQPSDVVFWAGTQPAVGRQHSSRCKTHWAPPCSPVPTHGLPPTSATATLGLPCSLHFFPDGLGHQYETTAGMPLRLRDWGLPGAVGGSWG